MISRKRPEWVAGAAQFELTKDALQLTVYPHGYGDEEGSVTLDIDGEDFCRLERAIVHQEERRRVHDAERVEEAAEGAGSL